MLPELYDVIERISGGVPLFIEQICQWVSENVAADTMSLSENVKPSHVSAFEEILDARLNHLGTARDVARAGAVAGTRFTLSLLRALLPGLGKTSLAKAAETLSDSGFLVRIRARGHIAYGFRHVFISGNDLQCALRRQRQALHRRLFAAVSQNRQMVSPGSTPEHWPSMRSVRGISKAQSNRTLWQGKRAQPIGDGRGAQLSGARLGDLRPIGRGTCDRAIAAVRADVARSYSDRPCRTELAACTQAL